MKKQMKHFAVFAFFLLSVFALNACQDEEQPMPDQLLPPGGWISQEGGILTSLEGNVEMIFPEGSVSAPVYFTVNYCLNQAECPYLLKMIDIQPVIALDQPVKMTIRTNCELANGKTICEGMKLEANYWDSQQDVLDKVSPKTVDCCFEPSQQFVSLCINQTGIYTIGIKESTDDSQ